MRSTVITERLQPTSPPPENVAEIDFQTDEVTFPVKLCNLPPFNAIASQILNLTANPDIDLNRLSTVIGADPALAADILFLANSSLFGFPSRMHSLRHAMALLGLDRIKALAITVAMRGFLGEPNQLLHRCWQHSLACALACNELAHIFDISSDRAYTAGIMHDVGRLGLLKTYRKEMTPVLTGQHLDTRAVLRAEREALNVDHARAGRWLVSNWRLPNDFVEVCERHHDAPNAQDSEILQLVKVGCAIADIIGFPAVPCQQLPSYVEVTSTLRRRMGRMTPAVEDLRANVTARLAAFEN